MDLGAVFGGVSVGKDTSGNFKLSLGPQEAMRKA